MRFLLALQPCCIANLGLCRPMRRQKRFQEASASLTNIFRAPSIAGTKMDVGFLRHLSPEYLRTMFILPGNGTGIPRLTK
ncbi:hypothetical protein B0J14DRAFT_586822 [Halenospora varia]|nr:hypothetical protein B0J14DRAFT_586822 [Halenospora varia]